MHSPERHGTSASGTKEPASLLFAFPRKKQGVVSHTLALPIFTGEVRGWVSRALGAALGVALEEAVRRKRGALHREALGLFFLQGFSI